MKQVKNLSLIMAATTIAGMTTFTSLSLAATPVTEQISTQIPGCPQTIILDRNKFIKQHNLTEAQYQTCLDKGTLFGAEAATSIGSGVSIAQKAAGYTPWLNNEHLDGVWKFSGLHDDTDGAKSPHKTMLALAKEKQFLHEQNVMFNSIALACYKAQRATPDEKATLFKDFKVKSGVSQFVPEQAEKQCEYITKGPKNDGHGYAELLAEKGKEFIEAMQVSKALQAKYGDVVSRTREGVRHLFGLEMKFESKVENPELGETQKKELDRAVAATIADIEHKSNDPEAYADFINESKRDDGGSQFLGLLSRLVTASRQNNPEIQALKVKLGIDKVQPGGFDNSVVLAQKTVNNIKWDAALVKELQAVTAKDPMLKESYDFANKTFREKFVAQKTKEAEGLIGQMASDFPAITKFDVSKWSGKIDGYGDLTYGLSEAVMLARKHANETAQLRKSNEKCAAISGSPDQDCSEQNRKLLRALSTSPAVMAALAARNNGNCENLVDMVNATNRQWWGNLGGNLVVGFVEAFAITAATKNFVAGYGIATNAGAGALAANWLTPLAVFSGMGIYDVRAEYKNQIKELGDSWEALSKQSFKTGDGMSQAIAAAYPDTADLWIGANEIKTNNAVADPKDIIEAIKGDDLGLYMMVAMAPIGSGAIVGSYRAIFNPMVAKALQGRLLDQILANAPKNLHAKLTADLDSLINSVQKKGTEAADEFFAKLKSIMQEGNVVLERKDVKALAKILRNKDISKADLNMIEAANQRLADLAKKDPRTYQAAVRHLNEVTDLLDSAELKGKFNPANLPAFWRLAYHSVNDAGEVINSPEKIKAVFQKFHDQPGGLDAMKGVAIIWDDAAALLKRANIKAPGRNATPKEIEAFETARSDAIGRAIDERLGTLPADEQKAARAAIHDNGVCPI